MQRTVGVLAAVVVAVLPMCGTTPVRKSIVPAENKKFVVWNGWEAYARRSEQIFMREKCGRDACPHLQTKRMSNKNHMSQIHAKLQRWMYVYLCYILSTSVRRMEKIQYAVDCSSKYDVTQRPLSTTFDWFD